MGRRSTMNRFAGWVVLGAVAGLVVFLCRPAFAEGEAAEVVIADFGDQADIPPGDPFLRWMAENGWRRGIGSPRYFFIRDGALHLVSKPGPVYDARVRLAIFDREKLLKGIENKVLVRVPPEGFRIEADTDPVLRFTVAPVTLPAEGADLRDSGKNDAAFYLLVFFDGQVREFEGYGIPRSIAYVWANRPWPEPVASDPDYADFMRYIAVGYGREDLGRPRNVTRRIIQDFRLAYPEQRRVPDIAGIGLMIDSNTLGGTAESAVSRIVIEKTTLGEQ